MVPWKLRLAALAFLSVMTTSCPSGTPTHRQLSISPRASASHPSLPTLARVLCDGSPVVQTPQVAPREDGVHFLVEMHGLGPEAFNVFALDGGRLVVTGKEPNGTNILRSGTSKMTWLAPPGRAMVSCSKVENGRELAPSLAPLDIVDRDGVYVDPAVDCSSSTTRTFEIYAPLTSLRREGLDVSVQSMVDGLYRDDQIQLAAYPRQAVPVARIVREGITVAALYYSPAATGAALVACADSGIRSASSS
jgi:hypothetical protein